MFQIHILDEKNTVLTAIQGNNSDQETCDWRKKVVSDVISSGKEIHVASMGHPYEPRTTEEWSFSFPKHGTFYDNGRTLQLMYIWNENKVCYSAYHALEKPCPRNEFPITGTLDKITE